ncbi:MAG: hypothetical protein KDA89_12595, partial [Planctomycetaceae bacterium]|nr:hypothetical protein [Planctomycetaceae bacterium]
MSTVPTSSRISELRRAIERTRQDAFLVEARVIRRVMRERHGFARLSTRIPHAEVLVVDADDVRAYSHPDELGLDSYQSLPDRVILVAQPEEHELDERPIQELLLQLWGRLFHGCIDLKHARRRHDGRLTRARVDERISLIGQVEFDEARAVLKSELRLVDTDSHVEAYCEFVAVYLHLLKFSPDLLPVWFPSLAEKKHLTDVFSLSVNADEVYAASRLYGAAEPDLVSGNLRDEERITRERQ